ncbi:MAG: hypothetical protein WCJ92_07945 [Alphaproteobacteria bacterium]
MTPIRNKEMNLEKKKDVLNYLLNSKYILGKFHGIDKVEVTDVLHRKGLDDDNVYIKFTLHVKPDIMRGMFATQEFIQRMENIITTIGLSKSSLLHFNEPVFVK